MAAEVTDFVAAPPADPLAVLADESGRHAGLVTLCGLLHKIVVGRDADGWLERIQDGRVTLPEMGGLWVAPSFAWARSLISVGRKDRGPSGQRLLLPLRLVWPNPIAIIASNDGSDAHITNWTTTSMGHTGTGGVRMQLAPVYETETVLGGAGIPVLARVAINTQASLLLELNELVEQGRAARWELLTNLEPQVKSCVQSAHRSLAKEVSASLNRLEGPLLDDTKLANIVDRMVYGDEAHPGKLSQILDRIIDPVTMDKVDPQRYVYVALQRDAKEAVRQALGDPRCGASVREIAKRHGLDHRSVDAVVAAYAAAYPQRRVSRDMVLTSLNLSADVMARWSELHLHDSQSSM